MNPATRWAMLSAIVACLAVMAAGVTAAPPEAPPVSKFAKADDLVQQVDYYVEELEETVESEDEYDDSVEKINRAANTMILISIGLGLHEDDSKYKAAAPAMAEASKKLAAAKDFAGAKAGVAAIKEALSSKGDVSRLKWGDVADLDALMKEIPLINSRLKRYMRKGISSKPDEISGLSATIGVIAQGTMDSVGKTKKPNEADKWYAFCEEMRDAAAALNAAVHANDEDAVKEAAEALGESCHNCHEIFKPDDE